jgi:hypothetical protein
MCRIASSDRSCNRLPRRAARSCRAAPGTGAWWGACSAAAASGCTACEATHAKAKLRVICKRVSHKRHEPRDATEPPTACPLGCFDSTDPGSQPYRAADLTLKPMFFMRLTVASLRSFCNFSRAVSTAAFCPNSAAPEQARPAWQERRQRSAALSSVSSACKSHRCGICGNAR